MTAAERQVLDQANLILRERFDGYVLIARATSDQGDSALGMFYHGQLSDALGLARIAQLKLEALTLTQ